VIELFLLAARACGYSQDDIVVALVNRAVVSFAAKSAKHMETVGARVVRGHVWVSTYSKCGTNFTLQIVNQIAHRAGENWEAC
jgi:hypothetical protein